MFRQHIFLIPLLVIITHLKLFFRRRILHPLWFSECLSAIQQFLRLLKNSAKNFTPLPVFAPNGYNRLENYRPLIIFPFQTIHFYVCGTTTTTTVFSRRFCGGKCLYLGGLFQSGDCGPMFEKHKNIEETIFRNWLTRLAHNKPSPCPHIM